MLSVGDRAPLFDVADHNGTPLVLSELLQAGEVIVYFYPADFTAVCTAEACLFRDNSDALEDLGVRVVGISPQDAASHQRFAEKFELPFSLVCDEDKSIIRAWGVDGPLGIGVRRVTFLVDREGVIRKRSVADVFLGRHSDLIHAVLEEG